MMTRTIPPCLNILQMSNIESIPTLEVMMFQDALWPANSPGPPPFRRVCDAFKSLTYRMWRGVE
jgi:hypothetical protein